VLNERNGSSFGSPVAHDGEPFDYTTVDDAGRELRIQVTRIDPQSIQKDLGDGRRVDLKSDDFPSQAREDVLTAVRKKGGKYPLAERRRLVLAVASTDSVAYSVPDIVHQIRRESGDEIRSFGFQAVWLCGPTTYHYFRLDTDE
jgi:hypothetical protein